jgi:hypothetical protein
MENFMVKKWAMSCVWSAGMAMGLVLSTSAHATPVCNTLDECDRLDQAVQKRIHQLQPTPTLAPIARTDDGKIAYMNQYDAKTYCLEHGMSLPTAYELAAALNPKGVSETLKCGFDRPIYKKDGSVEAYFNINAYLRPSTDEDKNEFWSSSVSPYTFNDGFLFHGGIGNILLDNRDDNTVAVRCLVRRR